MSTATNSINLPEVAWPEGWTLLECGAHPYGSSVIQLRRLDSQQGEIPMFEDDWDAWDYVVTRARTGSAPHREALQQVDRVERALIEASCGSW